MTVSIDPLIGVIASWACDYQYRKVRAILHINGSKTILQYQKLNSYDGLASHEYLAASYEYLCCPLRVPAAYLGLLNFAASSKKYLSSYR